MSVLVLENLLKELVKSGGSDLHLVGGERPKMRVCGELVSVGESDGEFGRVLGDEDALNLLLPFLDERLLVRFKSEHEVDFAFEVAGVGRFRANLYLALGRSCAAVRFVPSEIPSLDALKMPEILKSVVYKKSGLVLVTGATGSGKSTTLAALLGEINKTQKRHIITIEDPVEFVHKNDKSLFSQREVGRDTESFVSALRAALRQDPDVLLIGELRDAQTMEVAIKAAETGHLVFGTLHTNSAVGSVSRVVDSFEGTRQNLVRSMLASTLLLVVSQQLVRGKNGGRVCLQEILVNNTAVANLIREDKTHQILSAMQLGSGEGMQTMAVALQKARRNSEIE